MFATAWARGPMTIAAACALLALSACAPNHVRSPLEPRLPAEAAAAQEQNRYGTLLRMAASTRSAGDPAAAVQLYRQAVQIDPGRSEAYVLLGDALVELEAYDEAARVFEEALARDRDSTAAHKGYGRVLVALNRPETAIGHYQAVLRADPDDLQAYNGLAVAFDLAGDHEAAKRIYRDGLKIAPDSMLLRNNLGLSLALAGQHEEAIRLLRSVVDEPGARARNRQNLALAYGLKGDLVAAERVSRIDLDERAVENNLSYYASIAAIEDRRVRATAVGVQANDQGAGPDEELANRKLMAVALEGDGLELGLSPTGRWFLNLGEYPSSLRAADAWRRIKVLHGDLLSGFTRLASVQDGPQPLLVGPVTGADQAQSLCSSLRGQSQHCRALPL